MTDRAQAFTLEAFVAALLLLGSVGFALHVTSVTANTTSTASDHTEAQLAGVADGVLASAVANGSLRPTLLYWNTTTERFHGASETSYVTAQPPTQFGQLLERTLADRGRLVNVNIHYISATGRIQHQRLVHSGTPSDSAVQAVTTVTLYDDDRVATAAGTPTNVTLAETTGFYAPDAAPASSVYNVVRVEVIVWRV